MEAALSVRRSKRSASTPDSGASRMTGPWVANSAATQNEECVSSSTWTPRIRTRDQRPAEPARLLSQSQRYAG